MVLRFASKKRTECADKVAARRATEQAALKARSSRRSDTDDADPRRSTNSLSPTSGSVQDGKTPTKDEEEKTYETPHPLNSRMKQPVAIASGGSLDDSPYSLAFHGKVVLDERSTGTDETKDTSDSDSDQESVDYDYGESHSNKH